MRDVDAMDLMQVDRLLSDEERGTRERVRKFVAEHVLPFVEGWFERGEFPPDLARGFGELGILGMHLEGYGCAGDSAVQYGLANQEVEYGDSGLRSFVSVQGSLAMFPIRTYGSEDQRREWLPRMATGEAIGCFALTEPESGSDPSSMTTLARRDGSDWILTGHKKWNTNGWMSDVAIVWAKDETGVIRGFVVPSATPGVEFRSLDNAWSLRAAARSELFLRDVRLPADAVLPEVKSMRGPLSCLNEARYGICWGAVGAGRACYESALEYAKTRVQYGRPIAGFQLTQRKLVDMMLELQKAQLVAWRLGQLKDSGELDPRQVSVGKLNNVREALAVAREARTILGASGITTEYPIMRHANNLESVLTYEGTSEIHTLILGEAITGERALT